MPVLDKSTLRRAEIPGDTGIRAPLKLPDGCWERTEAGPGGSTGRTGAGPGFTWSQSPVTPSLLVAVSVVAVGGSQLGCLWVGLRVERSNMLSLCRSAYKRLKS